MPLVSESKAEDTHQGIITDLLQIDEECALTSVQKYELLQCMNRMPISADLKEQTKSFLDRNLAELLEHPLYFYDRRKPDPRVLAPTSSPQAIVAGDQAENTAKILNMYEIIKLTMISAGGTEECIEKIKKDNMLFPALIAIYSHETDQEILDKVESLILAMIEPLSSSSHKLFFTYVFSAKVRIDSTKLSKLISKHSILSEKLIDEIWQLAVKYFAQPADKRPPYLARLAVLTSWLNTEYLLKIDVTDANMQLFSVIFRTASSESLIDYVAIINKVLKEYRGTYHKISAYAAHYS